jgi:hypothetical protein
MAVSSLSGVSISLATGPLWPKSRALSERRIAEIE